MSLFDVVNTEKPLAEEMRPGSMQDILVDESGELLRLQQAWSQGKRGSFLLFGPAGSGKTSFIKILYSEYSGSKEEVNAVDIGIPKLREILKVADGAFRMYGKPTVIFIDEAHRLKAPQQDVLLPGLELGSIILLAATTETPGFRFNKAFLSRLRVVEMRPLSIEQAESLLSRGLGRIGFKGEFPQAVQAALVLRCGGDGRRLLGDLSGVVSLFSNGIDAIDEDAAMKYLKVEVFSGSKQLRVDALSAFIKSMRASDERAAVYYMGLLIKAKEDPEVMLRRMLIFASEDIGNANPQAVVFINSLWEGFLKVGMPEGLYSLYQGCSYLAKSPKSRRHVDQLAWADQVVGNEIEGITFPKHFRKGAEPAEGGASNLPDHMSGK